MLLAVILLFATTALSAEAGCSSALECVQQAESLKNVYQKEALELLHHAESLKKVDSNPVKPFCAKTHQNVKNACKLQRSHENVIFKKDAGSDKANTTERFLVFVSLSMPEPALQALYQSAQKHNIPLILRGLKKNSFKETATLLKALEIEVQINPMLFKDYQITKVPAFVWGKDNEFHTVSGNISLEYAQKKLRELL